MEQEQIVQPMRKITGILDILICLLLFISTLYKGAFYKEDTVFVSLVICMLGLVCLSVKLVLNIRDNRKITKSKLGTIVDVMVMLLPVAYFMPIVFGKAASMESSIFETIRYINFAIIYFIVRTTFNKKIYLTSLVLIGIMLAVLGIDELTYRAIESVLSPISINYLANNNGKLSSTIQYANITALIMLISSIIVQDKLAKNLPALSEKSALKFKILVLLELFSLIVLQSAIILTTSRMNILLMILTSIIYSIYCLKQGNKKSSLMLILMVLAALCLVTSIDSYLLVKNNFMVCFTYMITLLLIILGIIISTKFKVAVVKNKKEDKQDKKTKMLKFFTLVVLICLGIIIVTLPNELRINDTTKQGTTVTRNIYMNLQDKLKIEAEYKFHRNEEFEMHIYEVDEKFNKKILTSITKESLENNRYLLNINLSKNTESLLLEFTTYDSEVAIKHLTINGKRVTLSYRFIPDTIVFRLKDTLIKDSNNSLRFTYYTDALKLFNTSKLFGIGGEGFKSRYQEVQTENYISSEVHSVPLQILVEAGLIGFIIFLSLCIASCVISYKLLVIKNKEALLYALILAVFLMTSIFDLVFSFGIMIYIFALIIGLIIGEYKNNNIMPKDSYILDNKSTLGMLKIAALSVSLMLLFIVSIYSVNIFRASMIIVPDSGTTLEDSYYRVGLLENKVALDKSNIAYLNNLIEQYDVHIELLNQIYLQAKEDEEKLILKAEINNYIVRQKEIADSIVEYEYFNKYAIEKVARCYFERYISYAHIFDANFKNDDIAYTFYIGYAIKLTDRLTKIGAVNDLAYEFACDIYEEYIPLLENQNNLIKSDMLANAIQDMKQKLDALQESR